MEFLFNETFLFLKGKYINMPKEDETRDLERAEEYEQTIARATAIGKNKMELSTGLIIAARYADKLRRVALVAFSKMVPKDIIIRDISELNKQLYDVIVNQMKIDKLDVIRILVDAEYDEQNQKLVFSNVRIIRYLTEEQCSKKYEEVNKQLEEYKKKYEELSRQVEEFKEKIRQVEEALKALT